MKFFITPEIGHQGDVNALLAPKKGELNFAEVPANKLTILVPVDRRSGLRPVRKLPSGTKQQGAA